MRKYVAVFCLLSLGLCVSPAQASDVVELTVVLEGVKSDKGLINMALCSSPEQYYEDEDIFRAVKVKPQKPTTRYVFKDIPAGEYALKAYHDKNDNGKLDTGFFGIPKERYGFSRNPKIRGGMPDYEAAKFRLDPDNNKVDIRMR